METRKEKEECSFAWRLRVFIAFYFFREISGWIASQGLLINGQFHFPQSTNYLRVVFGMYMQLLMNRRRCWNRFSIDEITFSTNAYMWDIPFINFKIAFAKEIDLKFSLCGYERWEMRNCLYEKFLASIKGKKILIWSSSINNIF